MKQKLTISILSALLMSAPVYADDDEIPETYSQEWQGMGIGALVGAVAAGPPGFVIGVAGGALIGRHEGLESDLKATRDRLGQMEEQAAHQELTIHSQKQALAKRDRDLENERIRQAERQEQLKKTIEGYRLNIHFRTESAELEPRYIEQLQGVRELLAYFPKLRVHIDAYADRRGTDAFNQALTQRRARVVARWLEAVGVRSERIRQVPHGESRADYLLDDSEGMDFDRRVLLYFSWRAS